MTSLAPSRISDKLDSLLWEVSTVDLGALNLSKIGQLIINGTWDDFWPSDEEVILKELKPQGEYHFPKEDKYDRKYHLPLLVGPHQDRGWVKQLKELISIHWLENRKKEYRSLLLVCIVIIINFP